MSFALFVIIFSIKENPVRSAIEIDFDWKKGRTWLVKPVVLAVEIYQQKMTCFVFDLTLRGY